MNHILKGANKLLRNYLNEFIIQLKFKKGDIITITQKEDGEYKLYSFVFYWIFIIVSYCRKKSHCKCAFRWLVGRHIGW